MVGLTSLDSKQRTQYHKTQPISEEPISCGDACLSARLRACSSYPHYWLGKNW